MDREEQGRPGGFFLWRCSRDGRRLVLIGVHLILGKLGEETSGGEEWGREIVFINGKVSFFLGWAVSPWVGLFWRWAGSGYFARGGFQRAK